MAWGVPLGGWIGAVAAVVVYWRIPDPDRLRAVATGRSEAEGGVGLFSSATTKSRRDATCARRMSPVVRMVSISAGTRHVQF